MYVRTVYATGDPAEIDGTLAGLSTNAPKILGDQPGYRGFGLFADRELGKIALGSWWESQEAERASDTELRERRAAMLSPFARTVAQDSLEALVVTPGPVVAPGGGFRLIRVDVDPADIDTAGREFEAGAVPRLRTVAGFEGAAMLVDRAAGRASVGTLWTDRASLVASRGPQALIRGDVAPKSRATVRSVEEFEVVFLERLA